MRVLVTGGAGFIGSHVVADLLEDGHEIVVVDDLSTGRRANLIGSSVSLIEKPVQMLAVSELPGAMDCIVHLAARASVADSWSRSLATHEHNLTSTLAVIEWAAQAGCRRIVFASSAAVYGDVDQLPTGEREGAMPLSPYGVQKLASEHYLRCFAAETGFSALALRFFNVFGPRQSETSDYAGVIARFARSVLDGRKITIHGDGQQTRDFVYVADVARAVRLAVRLEMPDSSFSALNIGTGRQTSVNELAQALLQWGSKKSGVISAEARPGDIRHSCADISLARKLLGFSPAYSVVEGLAEYYEWLKATAA